MKIYLPLLCFLSFFLPNSTTPMIDDLIAEASSLQRRSGGGRGFPSSSSSGNHHHLLNTNNNNNNNSNLDTNTIFSASPTSKYGKQSRMELISTILDLQETFTGNLIFPCSSGWMINNKTRSDLPSDERMNE